MSKSFPVWLSLLLLIAVGCGGTEVEPEEWSVAQSINYGLVPRWSPDGIKIAFGDDRPGSLGIAIMGENSQPELIPNLPPHNWDYCWSPDGAKIAFTSPAGSGDSLSGVWMVTVATHDLSRIYDRGRDVSWGDSGNALYFHIENPVTGPPGIYAVTVGDTLARLIAGGGLKPQGRPLSNQVAYADGLIAGKLWISSEGTNPVEASPVGALHWDWSADGRYLFVVINNYTSGFVRGSLWRIHGDNPAILDSLTAYVVNSSTNRTGNQVVFSRNGGSTWLGIWINIDGVDTQISNYGENPDLHPTQEKVVCNITGGGIQILSRVK